MISDKKGGEVGGGKPVENVIVYRFMRPAHCAHK
jgi:hypothetical protein